MTRRRRVLAAPGLLALASILAVGAGGAGRMGKAAPTPLRDARERAGYAEAGHFRFVDVAATAGLTREVCAGRPSKDHLLDSAGTGVAWLDYDRDGFLDAYIVNGWKLDGARIVEKCRNALYRNRGDGTFEDVTDRAGVAGEGQWGSGVAVADVDGDGRPDLLVTSFGTNVLYRNRGDGTFENVATRAGIEAPGWNTGAVFFDADGDGDLDLYIAGYVQASLDEVLAAQRTLDWKGLEKVAYGPFGLRGAPDHFFLSNGDGTFRDATTEAGLTDRGLGYGFGVRAADFDEDGDLDIYVANDSNANYLYRNEGHGKFTEVGLFSGCAFDAGGAAQAGMGVTVGDANADGRLDIFVTNFAEDFSTLYLGDGRGFFEDVSERTGVGRASWQSLSWGTAFADLDNDGDLDLVVANGHIYPQVDRHPDYKQTYAQRNLLLENTGSGEFVDATSEAGPGFETLAVNRGVAAGDYDNDGDLDLLIGRLDAPAALLRNDATSGSWLTVSLDVPPGSGTVIGTQVVVRTGPTRQARDVASSESFLSCPDPRPHFGLGKATTIDRVEVRWPDGSQQVVEHVAPGRVLTVRKAPARPR